jgi:lipid-binding SYLF domain-containing protein
MKFSFAKIILILVFLSGFTVSAIAADAEDYSGTIETFRSSPVVEDFFRNSYGYAVFPTIGKAGYVVGGSYGQGQVYRNGEATGKTSVIEGSFGFQLGAKAFSEIIFFRDRQAYDEFTSGEFEFGAQAQAVAVTAGAQARAGTAGASAGASAGPKTGVQAKAAYVDGMTTFVHAKGGLMYELSVGGQKFTFTPF